MIHSNLESKDLYLDIIKKNLDNEKVHNKNKQLFVDMISIMDRLVSLKITTRKILDLDEAEISKENNDKLSVIFDSERMYKLELIKLISEL